MLPGVDAFCRRTLDKSGKQVYNSDKLAIANYINREVCI